MPDLVWIPVEDSALGAVVVLGREAVNRDGRRVALHHAVFQISSKMPVLASRLNHLLHRWGVFQQQVQRLRLTGLLALRECHVNTMDVFFQVLAQEFIARGFASERQQVASDEWKTR